MSSEYGIQSVPFVHVTQHDSSLIQEKHKYGNQLKARLQTNTFYALYMLNCRVLTGAACNPFVPMATLAVILICAPSPVVFTDKFRVNNLAIIMNNLILISIKKL